MLLPTLSNLCQEVEKTVQVLNVFATVVAVAVTEIASDFWSFNIQREKLYPEQPVVFPAHLPSFSLC